MLVYYYVILSLITFWKSGGGIFRAKPKLVNLIRKWSSIKALELFKSWWTYLFSFIYIKTFNSCLKIHLVCNGVNLYLISKTSQQVIFHKWWIIYKWSHLFYILLSFFSQLITSLSTTSSISAALSIICSEYNPQWNPHPIVLLSRLGETRKTYFHSEPIVLFKISIIILYDHDICYIYRTS